MTFGYELVNPQDPSQQKAPQDTGRGTKTETKDQLLCLDGQGVGPRRNHELENQHRENRTDRINQNTLCLKNGRGPRPDAQLGQQRPYHGGARHDDQAGKQQRLGNRPIEQPPCRDSTPPERDERAPGHQPTNRGLFPAKARDLEVEPALEQDHCDGEIDDDM